MQIDIYLYLILKSLLNILTTLLKSIFVLTIAAVCCASVASAQEKDFFSACTEDADNIFSHARMGVSFMYAVAYDPAGARNFVLINGFLLFDYQRIWKHAASDNLKFKVDFSFGTATEESRDIMLSSGFEALLYLDKLKTKGFKTYVEAGIGIVYTDYKVRGQGLHLNFNPRAGLGIEFKQPHGQSFFVGLRCWHLSNANLHSDNRGSNAVLFIIGKYFK